MVNCGFSVALRTVPLAPESSVSANCAAHHRVKWLLDSVPRQTPYRHPEERPFEHSGLQEEAVIRPCRAQSAQKATAQ